MDDALQAMLDHHEVSQVLYRYALMVDSKDFDGLRELFTDDATAEYVGRESLSGADAIVAWIEERTRDSAWQHHLLSVYDVQVTGDHADAVTYHTSHQTKGDPDVVRLLVARYFDRLRRVDGTWRIEHKRMETGWREDRRFAQT